MIIFDTIQSANYIHTTTRITKMNKYGIGLSVLERKQENLYFRVGLSKIRPNQKKKFSKFWNFKYFLYKTRYQK